MKKISFSHPLLLFLILMFVTTVHAKDIDESTNPIPVNSLNIGNILNFMGSATPVNAVVLDPASYIKLYVDNNIVSPLWFEYSISLSIQPLDENGNAMGNPFNQQLKVEYNPFGSAANFTDLDYFKIEGSKGIEVQILQISTIDLNTGNPIAMPQEVYLILGYTTQVFSPLSSALPAFTSVTQNDNYLDVSWNSLNGAEEYQLEWTWVDNYEQNNPEFSENDFRFNNTRVQIPTTSNLSYRIPLIYDSGYLIYRVRAVGRFMSDVTIPLYGAWSSGNSNKIFVNDWPDTFLVPAHQDRKNWQFQASYAEEGKKKVVVSYFDGTTRNRQTVTRINTDDNVIVGEIIYDNQGRPAIEVLPVPSENTYLGYHPDFNLNMGHKLYTHYDFDWDQPDGSCNFILQGMSPDSGASKYYSPNAQSDPTKRYQDYVPMAHNFPFSQIEYTPDNTGRIRRKGGVGPEHQLGRDHAMRYYYSTPNTSFELNRLFGYEVGKLNYYKKNMVIDPNGQASISYVGPSGKTIATALVGGNPVDSNEKDILQPLEDEANENLHQFLLADLLNKSNEIDPDTPIDNNIRYETGNFGSEADGLKMGKNIVAAGNFLDYTFNYSLKNQEKFQFMSCPELYPYIYDLTIHLVDDCGNVGFSETEEISEENIPSFETNLTQILNTGEYSISKNLSVNKAALQRFWLEFLATTECLLQPQDFNFIDFECSEIDCAVVEEGLIPYLESKLLVAGYDSSHYYAIGGTLVANMGDANEDEINALIAGLEESFIIAGNFCEERFACDISEQILLSDISPGGQYGSIDYEQGTDVDGNLFLSFTDPLSIFNAQDDSDQDIGNHIYHNGAINNSSGQANWDWRHPITAYTNDDGQEALIEVQEVNGQWFPKIVPSVAPTIISDQSFVHPEDLLHLSDFLAAWEPNWAYSLLQYHPEYCYLDYTRDICNKTSMMQGQPINSDEYSEYLRSIETWDEAINEDLLDTKYTLLNLDPYFKLSYGNEPPSGSELALRYAVMEAAIGNYNNFQVSMLGLAYATKIYGSLLPQNDLAGIPTSFNVLKNNIDNLPSEQKKEIWHQYLNYYLGTKTALYDAFLYLNSVKGGCENSCLSGALNVEDILNMAPNYGADGNVNIDPDDLEDDGIFAVFAPYYEFAYEGDDIAEALAGIFSNAIDVYDQLGVTSLCESSSADEYSTKIRRFNPASSFYNAPLLASDPEAFGDEMDDVTVQEYYEITGKCKIQLDLQIFLDGFFRYKNENNTSLSTPLNYTQTFLTINLLEELGGIEGEQPNIQGNVSQNTLNLNFGLLGQCSQSPISLDMPLNTYSLTWNNYLSSWKIMKVSQIFYDAQALTPGGRYFFQFLADVMVNGEIVEIVFTGSTCANLGLCMNDGEPCEESIACNDLFQSFEDDSGYYIVDIEVGTGTGDVGISYLPKFVPDRFQVWWNGNMVETPYRGQFLNTGANGMTPASFISSIAGNTLTSFYYENNVFVSPPPASSSWPSNYTIPPTLTAADADTAPGIYPEPWPTLYIDKNAPTPTYITVVVISPQDSKWEFRFDCGELNDRPFPNGGKTISFTSENKRTSPIGQTLLMATIECDTCVTQPVPPVSCNEKYEAYLNYFNFQTQTFDNGTPGDPNDDYQQQVSSVVAGKILPDNFNEAYFCGMKYAYITDAYLYYLANKVGTTGIDDPFYIEIGEFGDTELNYGYDDLETPEEEMEIIIDGYTSSSQSWADYISAYILAQNNSGNTMCLPAPMFPINPITPGPIPDPCEEMITAMTTAYQNSAYADYLEQVRIQFFKDYVNGAMETAVENFTMKYSDKEYQYTLYYYDQAGNLIQTVPPEGVHRLGDGMSEVDINDLDHKINDDRINHTEDTNLPEHNLETQYRYNSLNQLIWQKTPDGGITRFAYDELGRIIASQNSEQVLPQVEKERYSYTFYDELGRIIEAGEIETPFSPKEYKISDTGRLLQLDAGGYIETNTFNSTYNKREVTRTFYDQDVALSPTLGFDTYASYYFYTPFNEHHLKNRVAGIFYYEAWNHGEDPYNFDHGIFYNYDIHGNVKEQVTYNALLKQNCFTQSGDYGYENKCYAYFKRTVYEYDLISGNMKKVIYQPHKQDELPRNDFFVQRYSYDADNRLLKTETSYDGVLWEEDANYAYYDHGPLARVELGDKQVQGLDYIYTLQGWLKAVNGENLNDPRFDLGMDGLNEWMHRFVGRDAFGFSLDYFDKDYQARQGDSDSESFYPLTYSRNPGLGHNEINLYNGNIPGMITSLRDLHESVFYAQNNFYSYDQLNRIVNMESERIKDSYNNPSAEKSYNSNYHYDRNGNLRHLRRSAWKTSSNLTDMDIFSYIYNEDTNQLSVIGDKVDSAVFQEDIDDHFEMFENNGISYDPANEESHNYIYNNVGQLIADRSESIRIFWRVDGKVKRIEKYHDPRLEEPIKTIAFRYDGLGNRIGKLEWDMQNPLHRTGTRYSRDAQGNVLATYQVDLTLDLRVEKFAHPNIKEGKIFLDEQYIYGSKRVGTQEGGGLLSGYGYAPPNPPVAAPNKYARILYEREVGDKRYELTNHLGNVLSVVSDKKLPYFKEKDDFKYFNADVLAFNDYFPFGMLLPGRHANTPNYRYGFQGQEMDDEIKGVGNSINYKFRMHDPRVGRFFAVDPLEPSYPWNSPYVFGANRPIDGMEMEGMEYLDKDEALITVTMGKTFIKLENFSVPYRNAFRRSNPTFGLVDHRPNVISRGQVTELLPFKLEPPTYAYLSVGLQSNLDRVGMDPLETRSAQYEYRPEIFKRVQNGNKVEYIAEKFKKQQVNSAKQPHRAGAGAGGLLELLNIGLETYTNIKAGMDAANLNKQISPNISFEGGKLISKRSPLERAFGDVMRAMDDGLISRSTSISELSGIMNVVLYGGEGIESEEVLEAGRAVIRNYSSQAAKNRLIMTEIIEQFENEQAKRAIEEYNNKN